MPAAVELVLSEDETFPVTSAIKYITTKAATMLFLHNAPQKGYSSYFTTLTFITVLAFVYSSLSGETKK